MLCRQVMDFHFLVMEKSWKINVKKVGAPCFQFSLISAVCDVVSNDDGGGGGGGDDDDDGSGSGRDGGGAVAVTVVVALVLPVKMMTFAAIG